MFSKLRAGLTYANVVSTLCLFIVLGGGAYAATTITGKNVKNSSLTGRDVRNSSLTTKDLKNGSLLSADFRPGQLPAGAQGAPGERGPQGEQGDDGPPGPSTGPAGGALSGSYPNPGLAPAEDWHMVNEAGEPAFRNTCTIEEPHSFANYAAFAGEVHNRTGFYKDPYGVVHLKGLVTEFCAGGNDAAVSMFTLPPGYRPEREEVLATVANNAINRINVNPNGGVRMELDIPDGSPNWISLDGLTFRAAG